MRTLHLSRPNFQAPGNRRLHEVMDELVKIGLQQVKVYRTFVKMEGKEHILLTTSKDVHLSLGQMSPGGQSHFAELLLEEFALGECAELLVFEPEAKKGLLASLQHKHTGDKGSVIHLSPAH